MNNLCFLIWPNARSFHLQNSIISTTQSLQAELAGLAATLQRWKEANKRAKCGIPVPRDATEINSPTLQVKYFEKFILFSIVNFWPILILDLTQFSRLH